MNESRPKLSSEKHSTEAAGQESYAMNEAETVQFLTEHGIEPLRNWKAGQPVLYVLEEATREHPEGPYSDLEPSVRPSIARVDNPASISFDRIISDDGRNVHILMNELGGRIDYYTIDRTGQISLMIIPKASAISKRRYIVRKASLYHVNDEVFPPSTGTMITRYRT